MLWWFGNVVGGGDLVVSGRRLRMGVRRCLRGGVVEVKGAKVVVVWLWLFGGDVGGGDLVVGGMIGPK